ncbi:MAG: ABC transporter permease [Betaproteobacteria bacterium]|nr:ABC transporter permease [Betaproteobacteria bacterium]
MSESVAALPGLLPRFARDGIALASLATLALLILAAVFAPWIAPQNPYDLAQLDLLDGRLAPGDAGADGRIRWLGTDDQGRDIYSAILYGMRTSLLAGTVSTIAALALGLLLGLSAAWFRGWLESLIMRTADLQLSFPSILIALVLLAILGQGLDKIIFALVAVQWAYYARTARATALAEREKDYISAALALGLTTRRIILRHLLPNCLPPLMVVATVQIAAAISLEATLSFLGLGLPITEPSLGLLIANGYAYMLSGKYWISFFPGLALLALIVCINLVADRLRDLLDPRGFFDAAPRRRRGPHSSLTIKR